MEVGSVASIRVLGFILLIAAGALPARATAQGQSDDNRWRRECERDGDRDRARYCEVRLEHMSTNGGRLEVGLDGEGLDVESENGSVDVRVPADFAAHVDARSETGSIAIDFPVTVQGRLDPHRITTDIGGGGPTIRISSEHGSVSIRRR
jgi:hypothetical protein